ncbi:MAG: 2-oxo acid dehydrogenase subunit E2 [Gammaproteobacteria bacterium]|nr:2-oxo acid dehydrogenase subunit E2 [Gammaproteobacteria bacterium]
MASIKKVLTPDFGGTDVTVIEILVKPGDKVEVDTPVVTLESDKATMELPTPDAGLVKEILVKVGDQVATGAPILTLTTAVEQASNQAEQVEQAEVLKKTERAEKAKSKKADSKQSTVEQVKDREESKIQPQKAQVDNNDDLNVEDQDDNVLTGTVQKASDTHAGPGVRRLARELGVNLAQVIGSGKKARVLKEDIQAFVKNQLARVQVSSSMPTYHLPNIDFTQFGIVSEQPLSRVKKISGKNLQRNWMLIPHVTQFGEADITSLEDFRKAQKTQLDHQNVKLTPLVFVMKAAVAALKAFPTFNASLDATGENLVLKHYFHLGVAVDTPDGLMVPVVRDVDKKGLVDLAKELSVLSEKARTKKLLPKDLQGGCFSISSLGGIGGSAFTPIINYPEVAILGVSKASVKPVYEEDQFVPRLMLPLSLSYDHRVIDGAEGARFMVYLTQMLSDIRNLLL